MPVVGRGAATERGERQHEGHGHPRRRPRRSAASVWPGSDRSPLDRGRDPARRSARSRPVRLPVAAAASGPRRASWPRRAAAGAGAGGIAGRGGGRRALLGCGSSPRRRRLLSQGPVRAARLGRRRQDRRRFALGGSPPRPPRRTRPRLLVSPGGCGCRCAGSPRRPRAWPPGSPIRPRAGHLPWPLPASPPDGRRSRARADLGSGTRTVDAAGRAPAWWAAPARWPAAVPRSSEPRARSPGTRARPPEPRAGSARRALWAPSGPGPRRPRPRRPGPPPGRPARVGGQGAVLRRGGGGDARGTCGARRGGWHGGQGRRGNARCARRDGSRGRRVRSGWAPTAPRC